MEIKPTSLPLVQPGSSTQPIDGKGRDLVADGAEFRSTAQDNVAPQTPPAVQPERTVDAGESRIGSDPWAQSGSTSRLLTTGLTADTVGAGEDIAAMDLPDAVRGAVALVFQDGV